MNFYKKTTKEKEQDYLRYKELYYYGTPIISDATFDEYEQHLKELNSDVVNVVGFNDRNMKFNHPSPMLSLSKYQADKLTGEPPLEDSEKWFKSHIYNNDETFIAELKYDGNAVNLIYENGKFNRALSRGNKIAGRDYTKKVINVIPSTIKQKELVEIRCEAVISLKIFNEKYEKQGYSNARNFVAGVLNNDDATPEMLNDITYIPVDVKIHKNGKIENLSVISFGKLFKVPMFVREFHYSEFKNVFLEIEKIRKTYDFLLDGIVLKTKEEYRSFFGETNHSPNHSKAIKFKPIGAVTSVKSIEWNMGKTGAYAPVFIFDPVELDGTIVKRASAYNFNWIKENGVYPGSVVRIAKAGDIIPQVIEVISSETKDWEYPKTCKFCGEDLIIDGKQLACKNEECSGLARFKFENAMNILDLRDVGGSFVSSLFDAGFDSVFAVLNKNICNYDVLIERNFTNGKILNRFLKNRDNVKEIKLQDVIRMLGYKNLGRSASLQIAKKFCNQSYSFNGLEKNVVNGFNSGDVKFKKLTETISYLKENGIEIVNPEDTTNTIKVEFTGSPKPLFKSKKEFLQAIKENGITHSKINDANYLIADDINGTSSKIKKAKKMISDGSLIKIVSYDTFFNSILKQQ